MTNNNNQITGIVWMILHCFLITCIIAIAKFLGSSGYTQGQIVFFHSAVAFTLLLPFAIHFEGKTLLKTKKFPLHLTRGILGTSSLFLYFWVLELIPLTDSRAIALLGPVLTFVMAVLFLKEQMNISKSVALILGLIGAYIIINPFSISFHFASLIMIIPVIMWSIIDLTIKSLSKTESAIKQLFYLTGFLSLFSLPFAIANWQNPQNAIDLILFVIIGILFLVNSMSIFLAIKHADLTTIMPFDFSGMIFTAILSYVIFDDIIKTNVLIGSMIVFLSSLYLIYSQKRANKSLLKIAQMNISKE